jgi:hypothetical protein
MEFTVSEKPTSAHLVDVLYEFDPFRRFWRILKSSGQPKYLHSMVRILILIANYN